jgi:hypothetical protein
MLLYSLFFLNHTISHTQEIKLKKGKLGLATVKKYSPNPEHNIFTIRYFEKKDTHTQTHTHMRINWENNTFFFLNDFHYLNLLHYFVKYYSHH